MKTKVRPALFVIGAIGFLCLGYAFAYGVQYEFAFSWDGSWEPFLVGMLGVALLALAATADVVLKRLGAETRGYHVRAALRATAAATLAFLQYAGVFLVMWGVIMFLTLERAGLSSTGPVVVTIAGIVLNRIGAFLIPYVKEKRPQKETFVSTMEDDHES